MKKLDVLMIKSFIGPFVLTTAVSNFILLIQYLLKYFDDFVGKNLGFTVFAELLFYFALNMLQVALPLGVLVASLMTFGNLGENFELTAIKSSGISLPRILRPIFIFVVFLSIGAFFFNNYTIPAANLKAYSLLYDIKHTKPALDIKAGAFYNGIPNYSIKVKEKFPDGRTLKDVIIYDHSDSRGNKTIILADSSLMYTIMDDRYLKLELFNGNYYSEQPKKSSKVDQLYRTQYHRMDMVFSLASFDLKRRKEELFQNNRQMKNINELSNDIDSFSTMIIKTKQKFFESSSRNYTYNLVNKDIRTKQPKIQDSTRLGKKRVEASMFPFLQVKPSINISPVPVIKGEEELSEFSIKHWAKPLLRLNIDLKIFDYRLPINEDDKTELNTNLRNRNILVKEEVGPFALKSYDIDTLDLDFLQRRVAGKKNVIYTNALGKARNMKINISSTKTRLYQIQKNANLYTIERDKKYAQALACLLMFLIGAPLGSIIKKGGLGVPTIIAILFFIIYYVFTSIGEKSAKEGAMNPYFAVWLSDLVLLPFGLFFLRQAKADARLFDVDIYVMWIEKLKSSFAKTNN